VSCLYSHLLPSVNLKCIHKELLLCEATEWSASSDGCFLLLAEGRSYMDVFQHLRLNYIVTEYNSALLVENDHIVPCGMCTFSV